MKHNPYALKAWMLLALTALLAGCGSFQREGTAVSSTVSSADGSEIHYGVSGQGALAIVFIHCWTCNHSFWNAQIEYFSNRYRVAWMDLAGHGASKSNRRQYTMQAFGGDVAAVVNQIGAKRVVLVGHSMGGPVAVEAARQLGEKVVGIVGVDTFFTPFEYPMSNDEIEGFVKPFKEDFRGTSEQMVRSTFTPQADPNTVEWVVDQLSNANREMGISAMYEIFRWNATHVPSVLEKYADILQNINAAPTGEEAALHESVTLIPGAGHFVAQVKPDEFNEALNRIIVHYPVH